jgi:hypothetical protein
MPSLAGGAFTTVNLYGPPPALVGAPSLWIGLDRTKGASTLLACRSCLPEGPRRLLPRTSVIGAEGAPNVW